MVRLMRKLQVPHSRPLANHHHQRLLPLRYLLPAHPKPLMPITAMGLLHPHVHRLVLQQTLRSNINGINSGNSPSSNTSRRHRPTRWARRARPNLLLPEPPRNQAHIVARRFPMLALHPSITLPPMLIINHSNPCRIHTILRLLPCSPSLLPSIRSHQFLLLTAMFHLCHRIGMLLHLPETAMLRTGLALMLQVVR